MEKLELVNGDFGLCLHCCEYVLELPHAYCQNCGKESWFYELLELLELFLISELSMPHCRIEKDKKEIIMAEPVKQGVHLCQRYFDWHIMMDGNFCGFCGQCLKPKLESQSQTADTDVPAFLIYHLKDGPFLIKKGPSFVY